MGERGLRTRILVFDTDREWAEAAKSLLTAHGFDVETQCTNFQRCINAVEQRRKTYAIAIINIHAIDNDDRLNLLERFTRASSMTAVVAIMDHEDPQALKLAWPPKMLVKYPFGSKQSLMVGDLPTLIEGHLKISKMSPSNLRIFWPKDIKKFLKEYSLSRSEPRRMRSVLSQDVLYDELTYILRQLFSRKYGESTVTQSIRVNTTGVTEGHSSMGIIQVTPQVITEVSKSDPTYKPVPKSALLKFGPKINIQQESFNYDKWVEWFLTKDQTVRKIGYVEGNYWAGILYSYPRDVPTGYESFAKFIRHSSTEDCLEIVKSMFKTDNRHWLSYDAKQLIPTDEQRLQQYYVQHVLHAALDEMRDVHFERQMAHKISKLEKKNKKSIWTYDSDNDKYTFEGLNISVPNPLSYITRPDVDELTFTIMHGDLHGDNILVDIRTRECYFIDFFYTGPGHIYRDFIELELSVRYDLFSSSKLSPEERLTFMHSEDVNTDGLKKLIQLEKTLIASTMRGRDTGVSHLSERERKAFEIIKSIRQYARANCPDNFNHYYKGLIFSSLKALKYFLPLDVRIHRFLISGLYIDELRQGRTK